MTKLKPIILVSYFFPPIGMAGSARAYGLFRHLPEFGYQPYVVTVKDIAYPAYDDSLLTDEDERYIIRTESLDPSRVMWRLGRKTSPMPSLTEHHSQYLTGMFTPDYKRLWTKYAIRAASQLISNENIATIITTSPTPSAHLVGLELTADNQVNNHVKWIADYRDMWVTKPIEEAYKSESQKSKANKLLQSFQKNATRTTAVNDSIAKYVGADTVIPNGVDPSTCELWKTNDSPDNILRIGYLGTIDSPKTIKMFAGALTEALKESKQAIESVQLRFIGATDESALRQCFNDFGLSQALDCRGYLPRHQAIAALSDVDALLVTIPDELPFVTPSKVFDCLVSGKPLITLAPRGSELSELVINASEKVFASDELSSLRSYLKQLVKEKLETGTVRERAVISELSNSRIEKYSWRTMARRFASVLDEMTA